MLTSRQRIATLLSAFCAIFLGLLLLAGTSRPINAPQITPDETRFDGVSAIESTRVVAQGFPNRVTGTAGARRAVEYLRSEFEKLGYGAEGQSFEMWLAGERVRGENVVAKLKGDTPETVAVVAHYDGQLTSPEAAEDNASGVGVLLELARVLRQRPHRRGLIFVATDAEEWGMIGARSLVSFLKSQHAVAVISIDYLNSGLAPALEINCSGQFGGYTPIGLREIVVNAGKAQGVEVIQQPPAWEWIERAIEVSAQDQGPLLRAGIPALNIATRTKDLAASRARYHTPQDVFQNFEPATFRMLGATVEQAVLALDRTPVVPAGMGDFRLASGSYLPGPTIWVIQLLGLAPVLLAGLFAARDLAKQKKEGLTRHLMRPLIYLIPPSLAAIALYASTALNILKRYELYPATPKDPFLYQLPAPVALALAAALVAGYFLVRLVRAKLTRPEADGPSGAPRFAAKKAALFVWVCILSFAAAVVNPYAMWLYLGLFAYASLLLLPPEKKISRTVNAFLLLASVVPFAALLYSFGLEIFLGWRILWYMVLQAAYGVWPPFAVMLFFLAVVLWTQFFSISVLHSDASE